MQINKKNHKKLVVILVALIVALAGGATAWALTRADETTKDATDDKPKIDYGKPSDEQIDQGEVIKEDVTKEQENASATSQSVTITAANQVDATLSVRALIEPLTDAGNCTIDMTSASGKSYTATVPVQAVSSSSTCAGFDIATSELSPGSWNITVSYVNGDIKVSDKRTVTIQ